MPRAQINPDEVIAFASALQRKAQELRDRRIDITAALASLATVWKDEKFRAFEPKFTEALRCIDRFCNSADGYVQHVRDKARRAQAYLDH